MVMVSPQFDRADRARGGFGGRVAQRFFRHAKFSSRGFFNGLLARLSVHLDSKQEQFCRLIRGSS